MFFAPRLMKLKPICLEADASRDLTLQIETNKPQRYPPNKPLLIHFLALQRAIVRAVIDYKEKCTK